MIQGVTGHRQHFELCPQHRQAITFGQHLAQLRDHRIAGARHRHLPTMQQGIDTTGVVEVMVGQQNARQRQLAALQFRDHRCRITGIDDVSTRTAGAGDQPQIIVLKGGYRVEFQHRAPRCRPPEQATGTRTISAVDDRMTEPQPTADSKPLATHSEQVVEIFTDGSCVGNPGPGGWAALLRYGTRERELCGGDPQTTNNRMELMAALRALEQLRRPSEVVLSTDSRYLQQGITQWLPRWKRNAWRTGAKRPVKNAELWRALDKAARRHRVRWAWVRAHDGHPENERVDRLARASVPSTSEGQT